jgi:redox-sensitive bicupin YhaK (pirin superfamily)
MKKILHKAGSRGHANHGWLNSYHTFSFANYYDPSRMNFGVLRVLNDDEVAPGMGFGTHPHQNMEIISIPLEGDLEHKDSMGNMAVIRAGDVQAMSAGTGVSHSEYNKNRDTAVKFLQIWILPNKANVAPRYDQITLAPDSLKNRFAQIISPDPADEGVWIHQDAWFHLGAFDTGETITYNFRKSGNGLYAFVLEGSCVVAGETLERRDGLGIWETDALNFQMEKPGRLLLMEVPMAN